MAHNPDTQYAGSACAILTSWVAALLSISYLCALLFITFPWIDLTVAARFTAPGGTRFPLAADVFLRFLNELVPVLAGLMALFILIGLPVAWRRKRPFLGLGMRRLWFLALSFGLGPGLIANTLLKDHWGRARPRDITQFGGTLDFSPAILISDQCANNCSFISGDASLAFAFLALALILPGQRALNVGAALLFGMLIGTARIVQGAHFLSDVIFAGLFMALLVLMLHMVLIDRCFSLHPQKGWENLKLFSKRRRKTGLHKTPVAFKRMVWLFFRATPDDLHVDQPAST